MVADGLLDPIPENRREALDILQHNTTRLNNLMENIQDTITVDSHQEHTGDRDTTAGGTTVQITLPLPKP